MKHPPLQSEPHSAFVSVIASPRAVSPRTSQVRRRSAVTTTCRTGFVVERGQRWAASRTVRVKVNPQSKTLLDGRLVVERGQRWAASRTVRVKVNPQSKTLLEGRLYWGLVRVNCSPAVQHVAQDTVASATAREVWACVSFGSAQEGSTGVASRSELRLTTRSPASASGKAVLVASSE